MSREVTFFIIGITLLLAVGFTCFYLAPVNLPASDHERQPQLEAEVSEWDGVEIPEDAVNVQALRESYGIVGFEEYLKLEASVASCQRFGTELCKSAFHEIDPDHSEDFATAPAPVWFDPWSIENGITNDGGGSHDAKIWIDLDRGIFYLASSD